MTANQRKEVDWTGEGEEEVPLSVATAQVKVLRVKNTQNTCHGTKVRHIGP